MSFEYMQMEILPKHDKRPFWIIQQQQQRCFATFGSWIKTSNKTDVKWPHYWLLTTDITKQNWALNTFWERFLSVIFFSIWVCFVLLCESNWNRNKYSTTLISFIWILCAFVERYSVNEKPKMWYKLNGSWVKMQ